MGYAVSPFSAQRYIEESHPLLSVTFLVLSLFLVFVVSFFYSRWAQKSTKKPLLLGSVLCAVLALMMSLYCSRFRVFVERYVERIVERPVDKVDSNSSLFVVVDDHSKVMDAAGQIDTHLFMQLFLVLKQYHIKDVVTDYAFSKDEIASLSHSLSESGDFPRVHYTDENGSGNVSPLFVPWSMALSDSNIVRSCSESSGNECRTYVGQFFPLKDLKMIRFDDVLENPQVASTFAGIKYVSIMTRFKTSNVAFVKDIREKNFIQSQILLSEMHRILENTAVRYYFLNPFALAAIGLSFAACAVFFKKKAVCGLLLLGMTNLAVWVILLKLFFISYSLAWVLIFAVGCALAVFFTSVSLLRAENARLFSEANPGLHPNFLRALLSADCSLLDKPQKIKNGAVIFFSFEKSEAADGFRMLDKCVEIIHKYGGSIDKTEKGLIFAIFCDVFSAKEVAGTQTKTFCELAVRAATEMRDALTAASCVAKAGVECGDFVLGNLGTHAWPDITTIGNTVNFGRRLHDGCPPHAIAISDHVKSVLAQSEFASQIEPYKMMIKHKKRSENVWIIAGGCEQDE